MKAILFLFLATSAIAFGQWTNVILAWDGPPECTGTNVSFRVYEWQFPGWFAVLEVPWPTQQVRLPVRPGQHWFTVSTVSNGCESELPRREYP